MLEKDITSLIEAIDQLSHLHREALLEANGFPPVTPHQIDYLRQISRLNSPTLSELARLWKITKPSVTDIINHLSTLGYVEKHQSNHDLRVFTVRLTPAGCRLAQLKDEAVAQFCSQVRSTLSEKELEELEFMLAKVLTVF
jgi:DNA-binding MarR family transcriptional regulator